MFSHEAYPIVFQLVAGIGDLIVKSSFDGEVFGNFIISVDIAGREHSINCDRDQIIFWRGSASDQPGTMIISSLRDATPDELNRKISELIESF